MQYSVPQFIEVEDKVIGPLTVKQFLYILAGVGVLFMLWTVAPSIEVFLIPAIPILGLFLALAFYKVNGRPFTTFLQAAAGYLSQPKVMIWDRRYDVVDMRTDAKKKAHQDATVEPQLVGQKVSSSRLRRLSQLLDNDGGVDQSVYEISDSEEIALPQEKVIIKRDTPEDRQERERRVEKLLGKR